MSLINDVLEQLDARTPVSQPGRVTVEPASLDKRPGAIFTLAPKYKIMVFALAGFLSGYGTLMVLDAVRIPSDQEFKPSLSVSSDLSPWVQDHVSPSLNARDQLASNELSLTGELIPIAVSPPNPQEAETEAMLTQAKQYFLADRLTYPPLQNAYQIYRQILLKNPENLQAIEGINAIKQRYITLTAEAIDNGARDKAIRYLERGEFVGVDSLAISKLRDQLHARLPMELPAVQDINSVVAKQFPSYLDEPAAADDPSPITPTSDDAVMNVNTSQITLAGAASGGMNSLAVSEQVFLATLVEDKNSEQVALDYIKRQGNAADSVRWLARRWVNAQQWLQVLDLMNMPSAIDKNERDVFRAQALLGLKNYPDIISWLTPAPQLHQPELQRILAVALQKTGREADALKIYQGLTQRYPDNAGLWLALGLGAESMGDSALSQQAYYRAQLLGGHSKTVQDFLTSKLAMTRR